MKTVSEQDIIIKIERMVEAELSKIPKAKLLKELGETMIDIMIKRTQKKKTNTSSTMKPYSPKYNKKGAYERVKGKGKYSSSSKSKMLQLSGALFRSFSYKGTVKIKNGMVVADIKLYIKGKAQQNKAKWVSDNRPFFGLATGSEKKKEQARLTKVINKYIKQYTKITIGY